MAQPDFPPALSLRASRTFAAPRDEVFRAWITPEAIRRWFIEPTDGRWSEDPQLDPRPGQEGFPHEASREDHRQGWSGCFDAIEKLLSGV